MQLQHIPLAHPRPDAQQFIAILLGHETSGRVPLVEYIVDDVVLRAVVTEVLGREWVDWGMERSQRERYLQNVIQVWYRLGYDCVRLERPLPFAKKFTVAQDPGTSFQRDRAWADLHGGVIRSREDLERYEWPRVEDADLFELEYVNSHLPEGMGLLSCHAGGIFEHLSQIMSYEGLCLAVHDDPELVQQLVDRLGGIFEGYYRRLLSLDRLVAIFQGDDMGFRSGTLIAPDHLRRYVLPWHRRLAHLAHEHGVPYFLHSCGNLDAIMTDLLDVVHIDAKHSFEDAILPVEEFQAQYQGRVGVLGGVDVNILAGGTAEQVRQRTRQLIEICGARGRYAVGSGNSIPSYVPVGNYLAMVDEALACGSAA
ncbi:MAG: hypothetical protein ONB25_04020 [candidate division KSB1 bacterium]|nr:hypothetical protein [candidate division KSB1 bacterium]MDZ7411968.1 hypothetical protein [candidate division KSB1 bacterium]